MKGEVIHYWKYEGIFYVARMNVYRNGVYRGTIERHLDFISYHLIRWIHGEEKLKEMATDLRRYE